MYGEWGDLWEGFTKWTYSAGALSYWLLGLLTVGGLAVFIVPLVLTASYFWPLSIGYDWSALVVMQVASILLMRVLIDRRFGHSYLYSVLHPAGDPCHENTHAVGARMWVPTYRDYGY
ncbi:MAG: hypothetical protein NTU41_09845 [Chloroflexi bacterium]|nr:hypothetical protein [Chloroflexota bacterium]